jgi:Domain of unknown function (DUF5664)
MCSIDDGWYDQESDVSDHLREVRMGGTIVVGNIVPLSNTSQSTDGLGNKFVLVPPTAEEYAAGLDGVLEEIRAKKVDMDKARENQDLARGGVKYDGGKTRWTLIRPSWLRQLMEMLNAEPGLYVHLLPISLIRAVSHILNIGARKYKVDNWRVGMPWSRVYDAHERHMNAWASGESLDPETGKSHLWHAACNLAFLIEWEETHPELDDRPFGPVIDPDIKEGI